MKEAKVRSYIEDWYTKKLPSLVERELASWSDTTKHDNV
jgi:hypothetical protein